MPIAKEKKPDLSVGLFLLAEDEGFDLIKVLPPSRPAASDSPPDWHGICQGWFTNTESATRV